MDAASLIDTRADVRSGKPCFVGTRITVYDVLAYLASGMSAQEIVGDFPELTDPHIGAALEFASRRGPATGTGSPHDDYAAGNNCAASSPAGSRDVTD